MYDVVLKIFSFFKLFKGEVDLPMIGESITIKKTFFWDGGFKTFINSTDPSRKLNFYTINKGEVWTIFSIVEVEDEGDWILFLKKENNVASDWNISIRYFESKKNTDNQDKTDYDPSRGRGQSYKENLSRGNNEFVYKVLPELEKLVGNEMNTIVQKIMTQIKAGKLSDTENDFGRDYGLAIG